MRTSELAIGNWVVVKGYDYPPMQITGLQKKDDTYIVQLNDKEFDINMIEPVILTINMLRNNGLNYDSGVYTHFKEDVEYNFEISYDKVDNKVFWTLEGCKHIVLPIKYVHELQNILSLCNIDKKIIL